MPNTAEQTLINVHESKPLERLSVRYWGTEFEHPEAGNQAWRINALIHEVKDDSTIPTSGENCECQTCNHRCDCHHCNYKYRRCEWAGLNEAVTKPRDLAWFSGLDDYIMALHQSGLDPKDFTEWCCDCGSNACGCGYDLEDRSKWGFHTHVDARDLSIRQVATALRLGSKIFERFESAFGHDDYNYEYIDDSTLNEIATTGGQSWGRARIHANGVLAYFGKYDEEDREDPSEEPNPEHKATIEFRQFRYTGNPKLHRARVATARAIVDYAKSNKPVFWLMREQKLQTVLEELEIWNH